VSRIWETLLTKYPKDRCGLFPHDDMALAAANVMKAKGRTEIKIGGCDAMPPALDRGARRAHACDGAQPSCRIHAGALIAGVAQQWCRARRPAAAFPRTSSPTGRW